jgi:hypothetical protein
VNHHVNFGALKIKEEEEEKTEEEVKRTEHTQQP